VNSLLVRRRDPIGGSAERRAVNYEAESLSAESGLEG